MARYSFCQAGSVEPLTASRRRSARPAVQLVRFSLRSASLRRHSSPTLHHGRPSLTSAFCSMYTAPAAAVPDTDFLRVRLDASRPSMIIFALFSLPDTREEGGGLRETVSTYCNTSSWVPAKMLQGPLINVHVLFISATVTVFRWIKFCVWNKSSTMLGAWRCPPPFGGEKVVLIF